MPLLKNRYHTRERERRGGGALGNNSFRNLLYLLAEVNVIPLNLDEYMMKIKLVMGFPLPLEAWE